MPGDKPRAPLPLLLYVRAAVYCAAVFLCHDGTTSAGFLELGETGEEGAAREAREEMNAEIDVGGLLAVYGLPHIGQM